MFSTQLMSKPKDKVKQPNQSVEPELTDEDEEAEREDEDGEARGPENSPFRVAVEAAVTTAAASFS